MYSRCLAHACLILVASGLLPLEPAVRGPIEFPEIPRHDNMSDSDDSGPEGQIVSNSSRPEEISQIDETRRGTFNALKYGKERPGWPASWLSLVMSVRLLGAMCFWEIFSGVASLTSAFSNAGWSVAPPIDILYCPEFDLLNPLFLGLCLGLIFERRIRMLHVGPHARVSPWHVMGAWQP